MHEERGRIVIHPTTRRILAGEAHLEYASGNIRETYGGFALGIKGNRLRTAWLLLHSAIRLLFELEQDCLPRLGLIRANGFVVDIVGGNSNRYPFGGLIKTPVCRQ